MKSSSLLASLCATLALSKPLDKRYLVTTWDIETVTVTVTGTPAETTALAISTGGSWWSNWGFGGPDSSAPASTTTTEAPAPAPTSETWSTPSAAPTTTEAPVPAPTSETWSPPSAAPSSSPPPVAAPAPASSISSAPAAVSSSVSSDYAQAVLDAHNPHRQNASVPDLTWSDTLASIAQQIASSCVYGHNTQAGGGGYGQNIGAGADESGVPGLINNDMYNGEINFYPLPYGVEPDMSNFEEWGHYSQIVWKSTTSVGCYTQYCPNGLANVGSGVSPYFTVCNYSPPGNFGGEYAANVLQPGNEPTISL